MNPIVLILTVIGFIFLIAVGIIVALGKQSSRIAIISQLNIPNFSGNEELLMKYTNNKLVFYNGITTLDLYRSIEDAQRQGIDKIILSITSSNLLDPDIKRLIHSDMTGTYIASASTSLNVREEYPQLYFFLTDDQTLTHKALRGFDERLSGSNNVFIYAGDDKYVQDSAEIANSLGFKMIDATSLTDFTTEQKNDIISSKAIFISSLQFYHSFITSQIYSATEGIYNGMILFLNLEPNSKYTYPASSSVHVIFPGSTMLIPFGSEWNKKNTSYTDLAHPLVQCLPTLVSTNWSILNRNSTINKGSFNLNTTILWSGIKNN